jgi:hypothetical protein
MSGFLLDLGRLAAIAMVGSMRLARWAPDAASDLY